MKREAANRKLPRRSIRRQLIFMMTVLHTVLMASFVTEVAVRQQQFVKQRIRERTVHETDVLAASSIMQVATGDLAGLQDIVRSVAHDTSILWACVTDDKGKVLSDSNPRRQGEYLTDATSVAVLKGTLRKRIFNEGQSTLSAVAPIKADERVLGWAWVTSDLAEERHLIGQLRQTSLLYMTIAVVSAAVLAFFFSNGITRQLRLLLAGTERLKRDELGQPVPVVTDNEVGTVTRAFNSAMNALKRERAALLQTQARLEEEVRERRRAEQQLTDANTAMQTANESLRQFAYAASHDLQEPLRGISAYAGLLRKRYAGKLDADADEFIGYITSGAQRMAHLIRALLDYSRAGGSDDQPAGAIDSNAALATALQNLEVAIEKTGAEVTHSELPRVQVHEIAMVQLFQNLIGNAIKYAGAGAPVVTISARPADRFCEFSVSDNGVGIPLDQHKRIFGIFKRAHGPEYPGTGVGLAICCKIVERYRGRIWVESEPGKGATFRFTLPAAPAV